MSVGIPALLSACAGGSQTRAGLAKSALNVTMTTPELRIRSSLYVEDFANVVEATADSIMSEASEPDIQRRALMWKAHAIPGLQQNVLVSDPLAGMIDGWTFAVQMDEFFSTGAGSDAFGELQPMAVRASRDLVERAQEIARLATTDSGYVNGSNFVSDWAREHKIQSFLFLRENTAVAWADRLGTGARGGLAAAADINESITVISNRLSMYAATLPKQARWQAELMLWEVRDDPETQAVLADVEAIATNVGSIEAQFGDIRDVFVDIDQILRQTVDHAFAQLDEQIAAALDTTLQEDGLLLAVIEAQRQAIFEDVTRQRTAAMAELDSVVQHAVRTAMDDSTQIVDHMFLRLAQLLAVLVVLGAISVVALTRIRRRT